MDDEPFENPLHSMLIVILYGILQGAGAIFSSDCQQQSELSNRGESKVEEGGGGKSCPKAC